MTRVYIAQPCMNGMIHINCVKTMQMMTQKHEINIGQLENCSLIVKGRNELFSRFVHMEADYMLFVDSDLIITPPGCLDTMIEKCPENSIIGGLYAMKALSVETGLPPINGIPVNKEELVFDGRVVKMKYIPTGFMLIPRKVALKMINHYKDLAYKDNKIGMCWNMFGCLMDKDEEGNQIFLPEDFSFCKRLTEIGINIHADTAVQLGHLGTYLYTLQGYYEQQVPKGPQQKLSSKMMPFSPQPRTIKQAKELDGLEMARYSSKVTGDAFDIYSLSASDYAVKTGIDSGDEILNYCVNYDKPGKKFTILDVGANVGSTSILLGTSLRGRATIYAVEPHPVLFDILVKNIKRNNLDGIVIPVNRAIGSNQSFIKNDLSKNNTGVMYTVNKEDEDGLSTIKVNPISLDEFISNKKLDNIDILKMDSEGAEYDIFAEFTSWEKVLLYHIEYHKITPGRMKRLEKLGIYEPLSEEGIDKYIMAKLKLTDETKAQRLFSRIS
jgi:FkbM family methyltransferase